MTEQPQNWIEKRADCTIDTLFEQLTKVIEQDVKRFNQLSQQRKFGTGSFCTKREEDKHILSVGKQTERGLISEQHNTVQVKQNTDSITAYFNQQAIFEVRPLWNQKTLTCDLMLGNEPHDVWQLSQMALIDLLFDQID